MDLLSQFFALPAQTCFLFGPRGTGKTTWLHDKLPEALFLGLLDSRLHRSLEARPERLRDLLAGAPRATTVAVDEVKRVPEPLTILHAIQEEPRPRRFVLTGSRTRKLRRGGVPRWAEGRRIGPTGSRPGPRGPRVADWSVPCRSCVRVEIAVKPI